jgi:hypothetical protein
MLGGTYLVLFYLGMAFASLISPIDTNAKINKKETTILCSLFFLMAFWYFLIATRHAVLTKVVPLWDFKNPPGFGLGLFGIFVALFIWRLIILMENLNSAKINRILRFLSKLGDCTLYIFLYHLLIRKLFTYVLPVASQPMWFRRLVVFPAMLFVPCMVKMGWDWVKRAYQDNERGSCRILGTKERSMG